MEFKAYYNAVDHGMDNDGKPTALPMEGSTSPFALDVSVDASIDVVGGRAAFELVPADFWYLELGADIYSARRSAVRSIDRRDAPPAFPLVDQMWPDAVITDVGLFGRAEHHLGGFFTAAGTVRMDLVQARADENRVSDFFREQVSADLDYSESNLNAAFTLSANPSQYWVISAGVGTAVRTADATERYSDRIPASKSQTSAEFVGNPLLAPERSTQVDLWVKSNYPRWAFSFNTFTRHMDDYITIRVTDLPKRLPLSPNTVFRYQNGEAVLGGVETSLAYWLASFLNSQVSVQYLWGKDKTVDEPALGVTPLSVDIRLRYDSRRSDLFLETVLHMVDQQDRVASSRGERPTDGYTTLDLKGGIRMMEHLHLQLGVNNVFNTRYVNHLNANNPFAGMSMADYSGVRIPEPGRVIFIDLSYSF